jgi:hypothetical protein
MMTVALAIEILTPTNLLMLSLGGMILCTRMWRRAGSN